MANHPVNGLIQVQVPWAKNLRDADGVGKSDPYVYITFPENEGFPHHGRSSTIQDCLNPVWNDHTFYFLATHECTSFRVELFDEDTGARDDSLGYATILRRGPGTHKDDYYLEKGKGGTVHVMVKEINLSSGVAPLLKIQKIALDNFVKSGSRENMSFLQITIHGAKGLKSSFLDVSDPYALIQFDEDDQSDKVYPPHQRTRTIDNNPSPVWEQTFFFLIPSSLRTFKVHIYDEDTGSDDSLGHVNFLVKDYLQQSEHKQEAVSKKGTLEVSYVKVPLKPLF